MCEPLKNKKVKIGYGYEDVLDFEGFDYIDVKSAVNGYKNSLQKHLEEVENSLSTDGYFDGYIDGIQHCLNEIDKWFEDVIKDEYNSMGYRRDRRG